MGYINQSPTKSIVAQAYVIKVRKPNATSDADRKEVEIGAIQSINPSEERDITPSFEIGRSLTGKDRIGEAFELVPGVVRRRTLEVQRLALWTKKVLEVFGDGGIVSLSEQHQPFEIWEYVQGPDDTNPVPVRLYNDCYIGSYGSTRNMAGGDIRELERVTITYKDVTKPQTASA